MRCKGYFAGRCRTSVSRTAAARPAGNSRTAVQQYERRPRAGYFSDGISEDIITALSKLRWFFVIARNSSFTYKGKPVHMRQIAAELGVRYVVEGSVRKERRSRAHHGAAQRHRNRTAISGRSVTTATSPTSSRVQDEITDAIVTAIEPQIYAAENFRSRRKPPNSVDAWDLVMRALSHHWRVTRPDSLGRTGAAGDARLRSTRITARRWACSRPTICSACIWAGLTFETAAPVAERAALAAIAADSEDAWAHTALGSVYFSTRRLDHSLAEFELALQLNPNFSWRRGTTPWRFAIAGGGWMPMRPRNAPSAKARAIPLPRSITALPPTPSSSEGTIEEAIALARRRPVSAATSPAPIGCWRVAARHGRSDRTRPDRAPGAARSQPQYFARLDHFFFRPQLPRRPTPIASIISKAFRRAGLE